MRLTIAVVDLRRALPAAGLAASVGLLTLIRPTNLDIVVFCALYGVCHTRDLRRRMNTLARHVDLVAIGCGVFLLVAIPQVAYWHAITGNLVANGYVDEHLDLLQPHLFDVLFSVRKGLFFWTPLLLLAVAGVPFLRRLAPPLFVPTIAYLFVHTWIVASWSTWWYGGSFGMRPFVEALPILAAALAALLTAAKSVKARRLVLVGVAATTLLAVHAMLAYWTKAVPIDETTFSTYLRSFWGPGPRPQTTRYVPRPRATNRRGVSRQGYRDRSTAKSRHSPGTPLRSWRRGRRTRSPSRRRGP